MAFFSIIMPVYNAEKVLSKSVESVLRQTVRDWELIAIDDGSSDRSKEILVNYACVDSRIKLVSQHNSGPGAARNKGIGISSGKYIAFLDADDYWEDDYLEQVFQSSNSGTVDLIFVEMVNEKEDGTFVKLGNVSAHKNLSKKELICNQITGKLPWGMCKVIRREMIFEGNSTFSDLSVGEEAIFSYEVLRKAASVAFVSKPIYHYVYNPEGQHTKGEFDPWGMMVLQLRRHLENSGGLAEYSVAINSLAINALSISIYRYSCAFSYWKARNMIRQKHAEYSKIYNLSNIRINTLDKSGKLIWLLLRYKLYSGLYAGSKVRSLIRKRK